MKTKQKHILKGIAANRHVFLDGMPLWPERSQRHWNHSPDGFNWGYDGSGPAQLALAIFLEIKGGVATGYQEFKSRVIAAIPMDQDFEIEFDL
jgi:hypothetical protein